MAIRCLICKNKITMKFTQDESLHSHNAYPITNGPNDPRSCSSCNNKYIIPLRIMAVQTNIMTNWNRMTISERIRLIKKIHNDS